MANGIVYEHGPYRQGTAYRRNKNHGKKNKVKDPWREKIRKEKSKADRHHHPKIRGFHLKRSRRRLRQHNRYCIFIDWEKLSWRDHKLFYDPWDWD